MTTVVYSSYVLAIKDYTYYIPQTESIVTGNPLSISYPNYGNAGVKIAGAKDVFIKSDTQLPTASTIKLLTSLIILDKLANTNIDETSFTVTDNHIAITNDYIAKDGSIVPISVSQKITYKKALEYILVRSANNITDILVNEVFGSKEAFFAYAIDYIAKNELAATTITDPTGFAASTISSPADLLKIAELALTNQTISQITKLKDITLPNGTVAKSTNFFLPVDFGTIVGLKTGFTDEAKSVFVSGVQLPNDDVVASVIMGATNAAQSQSDSFTLAKQIANTYTNKVLFPAETTIASLPLPWGGTAELYSKTDITIPIYSFQDITYTIKPVVLLNDTDSTEIIVNSPRITANHSLLVRNYQQPSAFWKLTHPTN